MSAPNVEAPRTAATGEALKEMELMTPPIVPASRDAARAAA